jgi:2-oxoglutarate dehydrogenase E2 component (dihydrolipoamide succinyltransferase)
MTVEVKIPEIGESITEVQIGVWFKAVGDSVEVDEPLLEIESEKATVEMPSPTAGTLVKIHKQTGETANVGDVLGEVDEQAAAPSQGKAARKQAPQAAPAAKTVTAAAAEPQRVMPAARRMMAEAGMSRAAVKGSGPGGRVLKEDVRQAIGERSTPAEREDRAVRLSPMRRTIAERLLEAQQTAALLTTFNEVDMTEVVALRQELGPAFLDRHGVKLGFMSFFVRAAVEALLRIPTVNAFIRDDEAVYRNYCDVGIAVGGGKGLVVPVIRDAHVKSFADLEREIADYGARALAGKLSMDELAGGTFTITNGGIFGSLMSTPIVNPPQSAILGMHAIQERPVARDGEVVIRKMMYVALTYDHRLVDGREAVTFLKTIKELVEKPARVLLDV